MQICTYGRDQLQMNVSFPRSSTFRTILYFGLKEARRGCQGSHQDEQKFYTSRNPRYFFSFWYKCSNLKMQFWSIKILISSFASVKCSIYREIWSGKINDTPLSVAFRDRISMQCMFIKNLPESVKAHTIKFEIAGMNNEHGVRMVSNICCYIWSFLCLWSAIVAVQGPLRLYIL